MKANIEKLIDYLVFKRDEGYDVQKVDLTLYHQELNQIKNVTIT